MTALVIIWWFPSTTQGAPPLSSQIWFSPQDAAKMTTNDALQLKAHNTITDKWIPNVHAITPKMLLSILATNINNNKKDPNVRVTTSSHKNDEIPFSARHSTSYLNRKSQKRSYGKKYFETLFPLPERRTFPEVDWRGFDEDVFHESFGGFSPVKRWRRDNILNNSL